MKASPTRAAALAILLAAAPGLAMAEAGGSNHPAETPRADAGHDGAPTGLTGHYQNWSPRHGSGAGANNFAGNGRGNPANRHDNGGTFGGWFANNHNGTGR